MSLKVQKQFYDDTLNNKDSVALAKYISTDVWNKLEFIKSQNDLGKRLILHETTLTQYLVYEVHKICYFNNLDIIQIEEATEEKTTGNDLLLYIPFDRGYHPVPIQAKKLYVNKDNKDGLYRSFYHKNKNGIQIELLIDYANKVMGCYLPLYLFYNYIELNTLPEKNYLYGCSILHAEIVRNMVKTGNAPYFSNLNPPAVPFYHLFKRLGPGNTRKGNGPTGPSDSPPPRSSPKFNDVIEFYAHFGKIIDEKVVDRELTFLNMETIISQDGWKKLEEPEGAELNALDKKQSQTNDYFNPKYRIILVNKPSQENRLKNQKLSVPRSTRSGRILFKKEEVDKKELVNA